MRWILTTLFLFVILLSSEYGYSQYVIVGQNSFAGTNIYGPMNSDLNRDTAYSRHAYIYPAAVLAGLEHGDSIRSIEFFKSSLDSFQGAPNFKLYINNNLLADYGFGNINWPNRTKITGAKKVFDGNPSQISGASTGWKRFKFTEPYMFDTTRGQNLEILAEYTQNIRQSAVISWVYENDFTVPQFSSSNETKYVSGGGIPTDSTAGSNVRKPYIKINFFRYKKNLETSIVYALGQYPVLMNTADTIKARVANAGLEKISNHKVYLKVDGANHFLDSTTITSLEPYEETLVRFVNHRPDTQGREYLDVYVAKDDYAIDDTASAERAVNYNVYSHANPYQNIAGGIGFNGSSGDFVARFYSDTARHINQVKVDFSGGGQPFQVGIWEEGSGGLPGTNLFTSDTLTTVAGTYVLPILPRVKIEGGFFVGIRQTGLNNVAFGFQSESPIRPDVFYFTAPLGGTNWTGFSPGFDFNFNIQPRIQVANDVGGLSLDYPGRNDTLDYNQTDSLAPVITVINYGFNDQKAPFDVVCQILNQSNRVIYTSTKTITIKANDSTQVTFDSSFSMNNLGRFQVRAFTKLHSDLVKDNDTLFSTFDIVIRHDLALERFFSPSNGDKYEMNSDSIWPIVRVLNNGIIDKNGVDVYFRLLKEKTVLHQQVKSIDLPAKQSLIVDFDTVTLPVEGQITFEAFVTPLIDSFRINDTTRVVVESQKANDIGITNIRRPTEGQRVLVNDRFQPFVDLRNFGRRDQDSFWVRASIYDQNNQLVYQDSNLFSLIKFSSTQSIFGNFNTGDSIHEYRFQVVADLFEDQDPSNDTMSSSFKVVEREDLSLERIIIPQDGKTYELGDNIIPEVVLLNQGLQSLNDSGWIFMKISNDGDQVYFDSVQFRSGLGTDSLQQITFNSPLALNSKDNFTALAYLAWDRDDNLSNDTLDVLFKVSPALNLKVKEIRVPIDQNTYELNIDPLGPIVSVINDGLRDYGDSVPVQFQIEHNGSIVYEETSKLGPISISKTALYSYTNSYVPNDTGWFDYKAYLLETNDQFQADDTLKGQFFVDKERDVAVVQNVFPTNSDEVFYNLKIAPKARFSNFGRVDESKDFSVSYLIFRNSSMVFNSNKNIQLKVDSSTTVVFDSVFFPKEIGVYDVQIINRSSFDQEPRNDTILDQFTSRFGVSIPSRAKDWSISIDPNPANRIVNIRFEDEPFKSIQLLDVQGKVLRQLNDLEAINKIDISSIPPGTYFLNIRKPGVYVSERLLIMR